jgi:RNA recognition motif-containing protein
LVDDYRLFVGDLGKEVSNEMLSNAFSKYPSVQRVHVVKDKTSNRNKGYGFVSFRDVDDYAKAFREMNNKYVGSRPIKLKKSNWKDRAVTQTQAKRLVKTGNYHVQK